MRNPRELVVAERAACRGLVPFTNARCPSWEPHLSVKHAATSERRLNAFLPYFPFFPCVPPTFRLPAHPGLAGSRPFTWRSRASAHWRGVWSWPPASALRSPGTIHLGQDPRREEAAAPPPPRPRR